MRIFTIVFLFFGWFASAQTVDDFVFRTLVSANDTFNLSLAGTSNSTVRIDWGDGQVTFTTFSTSDYDFFQHTYSTAGNYLIYVRSADLNGFRMQNNTYPIRILQWGTSQWETMDSAFWGCTGIMFATSDQIDFSQVTTTERMFYNASNFNQDISSWDVANVTNMEGMFQGASSFNQPLDSWNVSNVTHMSRIFASADSFDQPLNSWDVSNAIEMEAVFAGADSFNEPLNSWDVSNATDMSGFFNGAVSFNQPLNNWDVSNVVSFGAFFSNTTAFNKPLNNWDVSSAIEMRGMFQNASSFNQPLNNWNLSNLIIAPRMFKDAISFNQDINSWDVSNVQDMDNMFENAQAFNQPLYNWDISSLTTAEGLFKDAVSFNQNISTWDFPSTFSYNQFLNNSGFDSFNYDQIIARLYNLNLMNNQLGAQGLEYCDSFTRADLDVNNNWIITGDSQSSNCPDNNLTGTIQYDIDNNGCSASDLPVNSMAIQISDGSNDITVFTFNGQYSVNLPDGTYTLTPSTNTTLFSGNPASANITIANAATITQDFCLTATSPINDLEIAILPLEEARPGFNTNYKLIYKNKGNTQLTGSVDFTYEDDFMDFLTATPAVTTSSVGSLNCSFSNLNPFETREIEFSMNLNTPTDPNFPLNSNDILNFNATISPITGDDTPLDNVFDLQQVVVNSYDPNDKTCLQGETILPSEVGDYVHYRIRFENEGTASAITVRIVDYIDTTTHDISTLTPLSASHDYTTTITEGNKVEFLFENINLPFTAPASQGYVLFKIKTVDTLVIGDDFTNQAEIFFDFNFPIITNLETTAVAVPASVNDNDLFQVQLVPNPATNIVTISSQLDFNQVKIYNTSGQVVMQSLFENPVLDQKLSIESLSTGLYFVEVSNGSSNTMKKLLKQ